MSTKQLPVLPVSPLPPLYAAWMDQLLGGRIPEETDATCNDCAMCSSDSNPQDLQLFYNPDTKCCTYIPLLPNFLVGRMLSDDDPGMARGRQSVEDRIRARRAVTPLGLEMPPPYHLIYGHAAEKTFGRSESLLCPHYLPENGGSCGVWKHRASVCATWHCKFVRGAVGEKFWQSLLQLLGLVERSLSRWCVFNLEADVEVLRLLFPLRGVLRADQQLDSLTLDGKVDDRFYERVWGKWFGREHEFYKQAALLVNGLDWPGVVSIGGTEIKIHELLVRDAYSQLMSPELPPVLKVGKLSVLSMGRESTLVATYSVLDPLDLPTRLTRVLSYFDGRPTQSVMEAIKAQEGITLSTELVRKLADFEVLVPAEPPAPPGSN